MLRIAVVVSFIAFASSQTFEGGFPSEATSMDQQPPVVAMNVDNQQATLGSRRKCQAGQVFCFEQMACVSLSRKSNKQRRSTAMDEAEEIMISGPVKSCKPSEIFCMETGRCRSRINANSASGQSSVKLNKLGNSATTQRKRRTRVSGNVTFIADFMTVVGEAGLMQAFKTSFHNGLVSGLRIPSTSIVITRVYEGSIIVSFSATQNSTTNSLDDTTFMQNYKQDVANVLDSLTVDNGDYFIVPVSSYILSAVLVEESDTLAANGTGEDDIFTAIINAAYTLFEEIWFSAIIVIIALIFILATIIVAVCAWKNPKMTCCTKAKVAPDPVTHSAGYDGKCGTATKATEKGKPRPLMWHKNETNKIHPKPPINEVHFSPPNPPPPPPSDEITEVDLVRLPQPESQQPQVMQTSKTTISVEAEKTELQGGSTSHIHATYTNITVNMVVMNTQIEGQRGPPAPVPPPPKQPFVQQPTTTMVLRTGMMVKPNQNKANGNREESENEVRRYTPPPLPEEQVVEREQPLSQFVQPTSKVETETKAAPINQNMAKNIEESENESRRYIPPPPPEERVEEREQPLNQFVQARTTSQPAQQSERSAMPDDDTIYGAADTAVAPLHPELLPETRSLTRTPLESPKSTKKF